MKRTLPVLLAGLLVLAACHPEGITEPERVTPASFRELVAAWQEGRVYKETRTLSTFSKIFFQDGSSIVVPTSEWVLEDCTDTLHTTPRKVSYEGMTWRLDGTDTGIARTNDPLEESFPIYAYYDLKYLRVWAANGKMLEFDNGWEPEKPVDPDPPGPPAPPGVDPLHDKDIPANFEIPTVYIFTEGGKSIDSKTDYVNASFRFEDPSGFYSGDRKVERTGRIRGRGNSTWGMPKKPYRIKLDEKTALFGGDGDKDWILLANYSDKSLLRNITMMEVSRLCGMTWTPYMLSVNVYLNNQYIGVYSFCDHKEVAKDRVNIEVASGEEVEGGYYLEIEEAMDEPVCFKTSVMDTPVMFHEPENPTSAQQQYVRNWFEGFESALLHIQGDHDYRTYRSYIDIPSFVNYYIIQEIAKNPDGNVRKSTYLTKEKGKGLEMYHVWDFDITLGNCNYTNFEKPDGWQMRYVKWYNQLFFDPEFKQAVVDRWNALYPVLKEQVPAFIDRQYELMDGAEVPNFERWQILGTYVWPNYYYFATYAEELDFLKDFYSDRLEWLNGMINSEGY